MNLAALQEPNSDKIIFPQGIIGFEEYHYFQSIPCGQFGETAQLIVNIDDPMVAFVILQFEPASKCPWIDSLDLNYTLEQQDMMQNPDALWVMVTLNDPETSISKASVNLRAPLVVYRANECSQVYQIILDPKRYPLVYNLS